MCSAENSENTTITALWNGTWVDEEDSMTLIQTDRTITGIFSSTEGTISNIAENVSEDGKTIKGTWKENGQLNFTLSDDGTFFNGTYGFSSDDSMDSVDDSWNGTRVLNTAADKVNWTGIWDAGDNARTIADTEWNKGYQNIRKRRCHRNDSGKNPVRGWKAAYRNLGRAWGNKYDHIRGWDVLQRNLWIWLERFH